MGNIKEEAKNYNRLLEVMRQRRLQIQFRSLILNGQISPCVTIKGNTFGYRTIFKRNNMRWNRRELFWYAPVDICLYKIMKEIENPFDIS